jgi:uncharacterized protein YidB (DUF937 family)
MAGKCPPNSQIDGGDMGILDGLLGGNDRRGGGSSMSSMTMALLGLLAYQALKGKNLSDMFGGAGSSPAGPDRTPGAGRPGEAQTSGGQMGGLGGLLSGGLGGLLAGGAGGNILSGGLGDLLDQFKQHGQGDKAESWVGRGDNKSIAPNELEEALGPERVSWLTQQTGMSKDELLAGLSQQLPGIVDKLTPDGHIPSAQEAQRLIA